MDNLIYLAIIILGLGGFSVALNIRHKKATQKPMVCPLNMRCEQVLYSKYAKFLGIPLEFLGMFYYGLLVVSYTIFFFSPSLANPLFVLSVFILSIFGFLFSLYLISLQAFKLKEWCSWCLMSAFISTTIFALALQNSAISSTLTLLADNHQASLTFFYSLATSLGLGLLVTQEILFLRFLKDMRISNEESSILHILRQFTWLAIGIMAVSNYALYLLEPSLLTASSRFIAKFGILLILIITNLIYDLFISSKLTDLYTDEIKDRLSAKYLRKLPFLFGPVVLSSWLAIFALEMLGEIDLTIIQITFLYSILTIVSLIIGGLLSITLNRKIY